MNSQPETTWDRTMQHATQRWTGATLCLLAISVWMVGCGGGALTVDDTPDEAFEQAMIDAQLARHERLIDEAELAMNAPPEQTPGLTEAEQRRRSNLLTWSTQEQLRSRDCVEMARECDLYAALTAGSPAEAEWQQRARRFRAMALTYTQRAGYFRALVNADRSRKIYIASVRGLDGDVAMKRLPQKQAPEQARLPHADDPHPDDLAAME